MSYNIIRFQLGRLTLVVLSLSLFSGCSFMTMFHTGGPQMLPPNPTIQDVVAAVNRNNSQIQSFYSQSATLSGPGIPTLRANIAYARPNFFRLRAETSFGQELDLGSNDQIFWFWIRRNQPPAVYYCRHDQFANCRAKQMIPIDPNWIFEALGTATLDASLPLQGPASMPGNLLQVRTVRETPEGSMTKITVIDATSAWVMQQHIYLNNQLLASSYTEGYNRDPKTGLFVPAAIRVESPATKFSMRIDLGKLEVNRLNGTETQLWTPPTPNNAAAPVNLADPNLQFAPPPVAARPMMMRYR